MIMGIPESQLETWSKQGATVTSQNTHESIRNALKSSDLATKCTYDLFLQGSYRNFTNVYAESDVDIVAQLNSIYYYEISGLTTSKQSKFNESISPAKYGFFDFRNDILKILTDYYGFSSITNGNKSIKVTKGSNRLNADVVVCVEYRYYTRYNDPYDSSYIEGIKFFTQTGQQIVNYPSQHYDNGAQKNNSENTNGWYKPIIRMFKNARSRLVTEGKISRDLAPSYFLECLLHNVPNSKFGKSYTESYSNIVNWLSETTIDDFKCQHKLYNLFGSSTDQWSMESAKVLINNYVDLWNNW